MSVTLSKVSLKTIISEFISNWVLNISGHVLNLGKYSYYHHHQVRLTVQISLSLPIHPYHPSLPAGLQNYILCLHRADVSKFLPWVGVQLTNTGISMSWGPLVQHWYIHVLRSSCPTLVYPWVGVHLTNTGISMCWGPVDQHWHIHVLGSSCPTLVYPCVGVHLTNTGISMCWGPVDQHWYIHMLVSIEYKIQIDWLVLWHCSIPKSVS